MFSGDPFSLFLIVFLLLTRRDIGSRDIFCGFGGSIGPMSTVSTRESFWSQLEVAVIEVGRVIVAVIKYDMVPLSNYREHQ